MSFLVYSFVRELLEEKAKLLHGKDASGEMVPIGQTLHLWSPAMLLPNFFV